MLPEPDLFQCGSPTCGTLGRRALDLGTRDPGTLRTRDPGTPGPWGPETLGRRALDLGTGDCGTLGRSRSQGPGSPGEHYASPGLTVLGPEGTVTLARRPGALPEGGLGTLGRGKVAVYSSLLPGAGPGSLVGEEGGEQGGLRGGGRRWYLLVIVLLYIGLITSFCLNVTLLVRREPERVVRLQELVRTGDSGLAEEPEQSTARTRDREFAYTTACLVEDPCLAGSYYSCPGRRCLPCPPSSYQPQWGQTSCWPCPPNTTTDGPGTASPSACKASHCVHRSRPGLAIVESPNYPGMFPAGAACHWRVEPGQGAAEGLLLLLPYLLLPPACSHTLTVRTSMLGDPIFSSCHSVPEPLLLTAEGGVLWVDFTPTPLPPLQLPSAAPLQPANSSSAGGFQLSLVAVPADLLPLIQAVTGQTEQDSHLDRIKQQIWGYNQKVPPGPPRDPARPQEQRLMSHLLSLLAPPGQRAEPRQAGEKPLIEVMEDL